MVEIQWIQRVMDYEGMSIECQRTCSCGNRLSTWDLLYVIQGCTTRDHRVYSNYEKCFEPPID